MDLWGSLRSPVFESYEAAFNDNEIDGVLPSLKMEALSDVSLLSQIGWVKEPRIWKTTK